MQVHSLHYFIVIDYFSLKLEKGFKVKWTKKIWIFSLFCFTFTLAITKRKYPKWDLGKGFFLKAFIRSEQLRRLLNDQNDWYNVLDNGRWFWKKNLMTPSMAYSVSVWFISATNGCYESDDISLKWIRSVIPSGSFVIFYPNPILFLFLWPFDVLVKNIDFFFSVVQLYSNRRDDSSLDIPIAIIKVFLWSPINI